MLDNAEIVNIFKAVGLTPGAEMEDVSKRRYGKMILMTDADVDGSHIRTLLLTFIFRHMRPLVKEGCIYIAQPPLYRVTQKSKTRYVQTHEQMMTELVELGMNGASLYCKADGAIFEGENLRRLVGIINKLAEPFELLERRGVDLKRLTREHVMPDGLLPRFRVFIGRDENWLFDREALDAFLKEEESKRGAELAVAKEKTTEKGDAAKSGEAEEADPVSGHLLQVVDLHEIRTINESLKQLKDFGFKASDFVPQGMKDGERLTPFNVRNSDGENRLESLRDLLPTMRKLGEKGMMITRFKGLGEMDHDELWATTMDPETRTLLQVTMDDASAAEEIFRVLMGDHVEPRREFIEKHALEVKELDV